MPPERTQTSDFFATVSAQSTGISIALMAIGAAVAIFGILSGLLALGGYGKGSDKAAQLFYNISTGLGLGALTFAAGVLLRRQP